MKTKLNVNKEDFKLIEQLGALYDKEEKFWYVPEDKHIVIFERFIPLNIELVPQGNWYNNLRSILSKEDWDKLRREQYRKAGYKCEICGGSHSLYFEGINHPVECHEVWEYDDSLKIQTLTGLIALCHDCHRAKHRGKANIDGVGDVIDEHIAKVNEWSLAATKQYVEESFFLWNIRSSFDWTLNIDFISS